MSTHSKQDGGAHQPSGATMRQMPASRKALLFSTTRSTYSTNVMELTCRNGGGASRCWLKKQGCSAPLGRAPLHKVPPQVRTPRLTSWRVGWNTGASGAGSRVMPRQQLRPAAGRQPSGGRGGRRKGGRWQAAAAPGLRAHGRQKLSWFSRARRRTQATAAGARGVTTRARGALQPAAKRLNCLYSATNVRQGPWAGTNRQRGRNGTAWGKALRLAPCLLPRRPSGAAETVSNGGWGPAVEAGRHKVLLPVTQGRRATGPASRGRHWIARHALAVQQPSSFPNGMSARGHRRFHAW